MFHKIYASNLHRDDDITGWWEWKKLFLASLFAFRVIFGFYQQCEQLSWLFFERPRRFINHDPQKICKNSRSWCSLKRCNTRRQYAMIFHLSQFSFNANDKLCNLPKKKREETFIATLNELNVVSLASFYLFFMTNNKNEIFMIHVTSIFSIMNE
jgi:uncharacterized protein VirK/YbjX